MLCVCKSIITIYVLSICLQIHKLLTTYPYMQTYRVVFSPCKPNWNFSSPSLRLNLLGHTPFIRAQLELFTRFPYMRTYWAAFLPCRPNYEYFSSHFLHVDLLGCHSRPNYNFSQPSLYADPLSRLLFMRIY